MLQLLWQEWGDLNGESIATCPIQGLFSDTGGELLAEARETGPAAPSGRASASSVAVGGPVPAPTSAGRGKSRGRGRAKAGAKANAKA